MKKNLILITLITSFFSSIIFFSTIAVADKKPFIDNIQWQNDSSNAFDQAKKNHQLVLLYYMANWCHFCQKMKDTYSDPMVITLIKKKFIPVTIDVDKSTDMIKVYQVTDLPTIIILDGDKNILERSSVFLTPSQLTEKLESAINKHLK